VYNPYDPARIIGLIIGVVIFIGGPVLALCLFVRACRALGRLLGINVFGKASRPGGGRVHRPPVIESADLDQRWSTFK
jgi:hypothetical protein